MQEQRQAESGRLMPPPKLPEPTRASSDAIQIQAIPAAEGPPKCPVPDWAAEPPAGSRLLVYKDGQVIQEVGLAKVRTMHHPLPLIWNCRCVRIGVDGYVLLEGCG